jgi:hypothetical protein
MEDSVTSNANQPKEQEQEVGSSGPNHFRLYPDTRPPNPHPFWGRIKNHKGPLHNFRIVFPDITLDNPYYYHDNINALGTDNNEPNKQNNDTLPSCLQDDKKDINIPSPYFYTLFYLQGSKDANDGHGSSVRFGCMCQNGRMRYLLRIGTGQYSVSPSTRFHQIAAASSRLHLSVCVRLHRSSSSSSQGKNVIIFKWKQYQKDTDYHTETFDISDAVSSVGNSQAGETTSLFLGSPPEDDDNSDPSTARKRINAYTAHPAKIASHLSVHFNEYRTTFRIPLVERTHHFGDDQNADDGDSKKNHNKNANHNDIVTGFYWMVASPVNPPWRPGLEYVVPAPDRNEDPQEELQYDSHSPQRVDKMYNTQNGMFPQSMCNWKKQCNFTNYSNFWKHQSTTSKVLLFILMAFAGIGLIGLIGYTVRKTGYLSRGSSQQKKENSVQSPSHNQNDESHKATQGGCTF